MGEVYESLKKLMNFESYDSLKYIKYDTNLDGKLSVAEFNVFMNRGNEEAEEESLLDSINFDEGTIDLAASEIIDISETMFQVIDLNEDGVFSQADMEVIFTPTEIAEIAPHIDRLIAESDTDGDNQLDYSEFSALMDTILLEQIDLTSM